MPDYDYTWFDPYPLFRLRFLRTFLCVCLGQLRFHIGKHLLQGRHHMLHLALGKLYLSLIHI